MSTPRIEQHHRTWSDLPLLEWPAVMQDADVEHWGDLLYMRGLVDDIENAAAANERIEAILAAPPIEYQIEIYLEPWTDIDRAADMLAAWRLSSGPGPAQLAIAEAVQA